MLVTARTLFTDQKYAWVKPIFLRMVISGRKHIRKQETMTWKIFDVWSAKYIVITGDWNWTRWPLFRVATRCRCMLVNLETCHQHDLRYLFACWNSACSGNCNYFEYRWKSMMNSHLELEGQFCWSLTMCDDHFTGLSWKPDGNAINTWPLATQNSLSQTSSCLLDAKCSRLCQLLPGTDRLQNIKISCTCDRTDPLYRH